MTLSRWADSLPVQGSGMHRWVNAIGVYHRSRTRFGLCYCPVCLDELPVFNVHWRLSYWTVCPLHCVSLCDACPHCGAALEIHRQRVDIRRCIRCHEPLTQHSGSRGMPTFTQTALTAAALIPATVQYGLCSVASGQDYLCGMRALLSAFHTARAPDPQDARHLRARIELRRINGRHSDLGLLDRIVRAWPHSMLSLAEQYSLTQRSFRQECPDWICKALAQLPPGRANGQLRPSLAAVRAAKSAQLARGVGWRTMRARALIEMAEH